MTDTDGVRTAERNRRLSARLAAFARDVITELRQARLPGLAAEVAYSLIFAMPSILLIVTLIALQVDRRTGFAITAEVRRAIITTLPQDVQQVMMGLLDNAVQRASAGPTTVSAIVSILVALALAGNGFAALSAACCAAAHIEDQRSAWVKRVISTIAAVAIAVLLIAALTFLLWGGDLLRALGERFGVSDAQWATWDRIHFPVLLVLVFLGITLLYMAGTEQYAFWRMAPGALVSTLLWLAVVKGFQIYLQLAPPGTAYGAASGLLVFLVFLYVSAMVLIVGGMIAAVLAREMRDGPRPRVQSSARQGRQPGSDDAS
jgi:membrane protein